MDAKYTLNRIQILYQAQEALDTLAHLLRPPLPLLSATSSRSNSV